ncbi:MAG: hypothetical protein LIV11_10115 [Bacillota bacterium]|nr:hypothetical protein [Bacillota bacterium]
MEFSIRDISSVQDFADLIDSCSHDVYVESVSGDRLNLKSTLTRFAFMTKLASGQRNSDFRLFFSNTDDEKKVRRYMSTV